MTDAHIQHLTEIIEKRQSIFPKQFTGKQIPDDAIEWILRNAIKAPSHRRTNPWRYHVIPPSQRMRVSAFFKKIYTEHQPKDEFKEEKLASFDQKCSASSHILILCARHDLQQRVPKWEEIASLSCGVQNIYLSITAAGFGGYWSSPKLMIDHIGELIALEENETCYGFFYLGVPQTTLPPVQQHASMDEFVQWHTEDDIL